VIPVRNFRVRALSFGLLVLCLLMIPPSFVHAQTVPHLTVTLTGQALTGGFNNNVTVTVLNGYFTAIYDVDVALNIPSTLTMYGDSHWHYSSLQLGQSVTVTFEVYAPTATIGTASQGSVTVSYKQLGDISYTQEVHSVSFSVQAWIHLVMYGVQLTPSISTPGGNSTISGNLLNSGNLASYNANVTVQSDAIVPSSLSSVFLGEIDPNIPRPFSVLVVFKSNLAPGNYSLVVKASAIDNGKPASPYTAESTVTIQLRRVNPSQNQRGQGAGGVVGIIFAILRYLMQVFFGSTSPFALRRSVFVTSSFVTGSGRSLSQVPQ
jgi:hypothetical protein